MAALEAEACCGRERREVLARPLRFNGSAPRAGGIREQEFCVIEMAAI